MHLTYNDIDLKIVRVLAYQRTPEYDPTGQDYLWTRHTLAVEAIYSAEKAKSFRDADWTFVNADSLAPIPAGGTVPHDGPNVGPDPLKPTLGTPKVRSAPMTDVALRHKLMQPRGKLRVEFNSFIDTTGSGNPVEVHLASPGKDVDGVDRKCDLNNGPIPQECTPTVMGDGRTFLVRYVIETCMSDCRPSREDKALVSNRWTATLSYDENFFATRTLTGLAIFRADAINTRQTWPDLYRLQLLPPVPGNCKRYIDALEASPDGFSYRYVVRDVEEERTYLDTRITPAGSAIEGTKPRRIASVRGTVRRSLSQPGSKTAFSEAMQQLTNVAFAASAFEDIGGGGGGGTKLPNTNPYSGGLAQRFGGVSGGRMGWLALLFKVAGVGVKASASFMAAANSVLPTYEETVVVEVRGTRYATRADLQEAALAAAFGQLTNVVGANIPFADQTSDIGLGGSNIQNAVGSFVKGLAGGMLAGVNSIAGKTALVTPVANVYELEYDLHERRVQVTVSQEYSGLMDWVSGRTAGGWKAITRPLHDTDKGGIWPFSAQYNGAIEGIQSGEIMKFLADAGYPMIVGTDGPGRGPPVDINGKQGTNLATVIAGDLLGECDEPPAYAFDSPTPRPTNTALNGPWKFPDPP